jgi:N-acetyl-anhydromuramyl-L-alanine amidase AmpD
MNSSRSLLPLLACLLLFSTGCAPRWVERDSVLVDVIPRESWDARPWLEGMQRQTVSHITVHHTAERLNPERDLADKLQALQRFSQSEATLADGRQKVAWADIPYHYFIDVHGMIAEARPIGYCGDTNTAYDPCGHALIVLEGNFEEDEPTPAQIMSLARMTRQLSSRYDVPASRIGGHQDYAPTLCPGAALARIIPQLRDLVQDS